MGLLGRVTLEVRLGHQVCTQEFYVSSVLCHECIAGTDLLEKLGLNVQPRQRCATVEGSVKRIPFLGQEPNRPRFTPVAASLVSAVTIGPLTEMLLPVATPSTDPTHRPSGESAVCAAETPAEGARDPTDHPTLTGRIQEDVGCAFPGLNDEQLRRTQQRDPDLAAVEADLREKKDALPGPWSGLYARLCVQNGVVWELTEAGQPGCICVPAQVRPQLLRLVHDNPLRSHNRERRTREILRRQYLWPKLT
ncbi:uncharacterized protein LOC116938309 [Petromyzon marinus]|uniref:Uncharacterized protein LOC116938309 n=1 Tax=Petromyzon marinus TaxID=7757 RepID=A0AAJ7WKN9_PETMA|nr:uncharacterized protein LOC116938309 [Petromyzon marinus]